MKTYAKIITSIPSILSLLTILDMFTIDFMWKMFPSMKAYHIQIVILLIIGIISWSYLFWRLWTYKYIDQRKKITWTFMMIFVFGQITTLYYIWIKDDQFIFENNQNKEYLF